MSEEQLQLPVGVQHQFPDFDRPAEKSGDAQARPTQYVIADDGLKAERVGHWVTKKHKRLADYVQISGGARRKFSVGKPAFIDVFCGAGRAQIRETGKFVDGSAVAAFKAGQRSLAGFSSIEISDAEPELLAAAAYRLRKVGAPTRLAAGPAKTAIREIVSRLDPYGLHFAFLDPHNLGALSFSIFKELAHLHHVDALVHVSIADMQRNADTYSAEDQEQFDEFAPGWRDCVSTNQSRRAFRGEMMEYWSAKVEALGLPRARHCELITGSQEQRLYWLILLSKHPLAHEFWSKISSEAQAPDLGL